MVIRARPCHTPQRSIPTAQTIPHRSSVSPSINIARASMSTMVERAKSSKPLSLDRVSLKLPEGWTLRRMELTDMHKKRNSPDKTKKLNSQEDPVLQYEQYKNKYLETYEDYAEERVKDYLRIGRKKSEIDWGKIKKSYEIYCHGAYNSYKLKLEQHNPGFIL